VRVSEISFGSPDVCKDPLSEAPENNYFSGKVVGPRGCIFGLLGPEDRSTTPFVRNWQGGVTYTQIVLDFVREESLVPRL
jgi:hypothetical protein